MKKILGNEKVIRLLMIVSQVLLLLFLVRWVDARFDAEEQKLERDLSLQFQLMEGELMDSLIMKQFSGTIKDSRARVFINRSRDSAEGMDGSTVRYSRIIKMEVPDSIRNMPQSMSVEEEIIRNTAPDRGSRPRLPERLPLDVLDSVGGIPNRQLAKGIRIFLDRQLGAGPVKLSDTLLQREFTRRVHQQGMPFSVRWTRTPDRKSLVVFSHAKPQKSTLVVTRYGHYVWKELLPELLDATILFTVTALAFWMMSRSLQQQTRLSAMRNDLVSNMTHELKTPIATVKVALEALDNFQVIEDPKTSREYVRMAVSEVERLELLVNQTLTTSLLEGGAMKMNNEPIDSANLLEQTIALLQPKLQQQRATISLAKEGEYFIVMADKLHLQGVIINLLDNAVKYAGPNAQIQVAIREPGEKVLIEVADNGPGIPEKYLGKVFEKFFRVPQGNVHNIKGYGLGLSYARQVVQHAGGMLEVQNREDGGCLFVMSLPKA